MPDFAHLGDNIRTKVGKTDIMMVDFKEYFKNQPW